MMSPFSSEEELIATIDELVEMGLIEVEQGDEPRLGLTLAGHEISKHFYVIGGAA